MANFVTHSTNLNQNELTKGSPMTCMKPLCAKVCFYVNTCDCSPLTPWPSFLFHFWVLNYFYFTGPTRPTRSYASVSIFKFNDGN